MEKIKLKIKTTKVISTDSLIEGQYTFEISNLDSLKNKTILLPKLIDFKK